MYAKNPRTVVI